LWLDPDRFPGCQRAPVSWWSKDAHREGEVAAAGLLRLVIGLEQVPAEKAGGAWREELTLPEGRSSYQSVAYFSARRRTACLRL
jgi:hypothetical protein